MPHRLSPQRGVHWVGAKSLSLASYVGGLSLLLGRTLYSALRGILPGHTKFYFRQMLAQMVRVGVRPVGVVVLVQLFIGVILALQMTPPLEPFRQEDKVAMIIGVAGFRMLGPIITAVVLSGFAGASIAAELGTMVVAEEIEALEATALNPVRFLVVPRVLATLVMMIFLSAIANLMIALGGYLAARLVLAPSVWVSYWSNMRTQLRFLDFVTGQVMAAVFGLLISGIACFEGCRVSGGAEGVGRATTVTVVYSIIAIVISAAIFTAIFYAYEW